MTYEKNIQNIAEKLNIKMIPEHVILKITKMDEKLNIIAGWEENRIIKDTNTLLEFGHIEVGWRESCGATDKTMKAYREWKKAISILRKAGIDITEEVVKHKNAYATLSGGFWNSIRYSLKSGSFGINEQL